MLRLHARRTVFRVLVAAFALWLPAATGQGGKATVVAAQSLAKSMHERPHLSCHGEKRNCCCKGKVTLRATACGCHDGETVVGTSAHDPMLAAWITGPAHPAATRMVRPGNGQPRESFAEAPELPPPELSFPLQA